MGITLAEGLKIVIKLGALALTVSVVDALLEEAGKKEWVVKVNIVTGVTAVIVVYGVVKSAFDVIQTFSNLVN